MGGSKQQGDPFAELSKAIAQGEPDVVQHGLRGGQSSEFGLGSHT